MWAVPRPRSSVGEAVEACTEGMEDFELAVKVRGAAAEMALKGEVFERYAAAASLYQLEAAWFKLDAVTNAEMSDLYSGRLVGAVKGRKIYDHIKGLAVDGRCAYCRHGRVSTLDHVLPKKSFGSLAINPRTLYPPARNAIKRSVA